MITPFYNAGEFLQNSVNSLISQSYDNFRIIFIDDASTDNCSQFLPKDDPRATIITNKVRLTALENIHNAVINHCDPEDIVVLLDGDDSLYKRTSLTSVAEFYEQHNEAWFVYGSCCWVTTDGVGSRSRGFESPYSEEEFKNVRKAPFRVSHLRTFLAKLYMKTFTGHEDQLKDKKGEFFKSGYDVPIVFGLLESAGQEHTFYNPQILCKYNFSNPISDHRVSQVHQTSVHIECSNKPSLKKLDTL